MKSQADDFRILLSGDCAVSVDFGNVISPEINKKVHNMRKALDGKNGIVETVPTFRALTVIYNPNILSYKKLCRVINNAYTDSLSGSSGEKKRRVFHIPVCYGGEYGEDLADVAKLTGLSEDDLIKRHSSPEYLIYMLGFLPGFPYLGGLDETIAVPRLSSPRTVIPVGSVGIGGEQTGIYPLSSPGGWRLLGRTPLLPYDSKREPAILYEAGDYIKFEPIDEKTYKLIEAKVISGTYSCEVT